MHRSALYIVLVVIGCIYLAIAINVAKIHWDQEQLMHEYKAPKVTDR